MHAFSASTEKKKKKNDGKITEFCPRRIFPGLYSMSFEQESSDLFQSPVIDVGSFDFVPR